MFDLILTLRLLKQILQFKSHSHLPLLYIILFDELCERFKISGIEKYKPVVAESAHLTFSDHELVYGIPFDVLLANSLNRHYSSVFLRFCGSLFYNFLVYHHNERCFSLFDAIFTAVSEQHRYLVNLDHNV